MTDAAADGAATNADLVAIPTSEVPLAPTFLQSAPWAGFKAAGGWQSRAVVDPRTESTTLVLIRPLVRRAGVDQPVLPSLAYVPFGPDPTVTAAPGRLRAWCAGCLGLLPPSVMVLRIDPGAAFDSAELCAERTVDWAGDEGLRKAALDVQPRASVLLDIRSDPDTLLAQMKSKTRYNIRLAEKRGVRVAEAAPVKVVQWYGLYQETARRDRIAIHPPEYYRRLFESPWGRDGARARLYLASVGDEVVAGIITLFYGGTTTYLYGASADRHRNLMPNYLLQWTAIRDAQADGAHTYDLYGIPAAADADHPMFGLYQFKTGFGGRIVHYPGTWDCVRRPVWYGVYQAFEAWRIRRRRQRHA